jgi:hypothetical protein
MHGEVSPPLLDPSTRTTNDGIRAAWITNLNTDHLLQNSDFYRHGYGTLAAHENPRTDAELVSLLQTVPSTSLSGLDAFKPDSKAYRKELNFNTSMFTEPILQNYQEYARTRYSRRLTVETTAEELDIREKQLQTLQEFIIGRGNQEFEARVRPYGRSALWQTGDYKPATTPAAAIMFADSDDEDIMEKVERINTGDRLHTAELGKMGMDTDEMSLFVDGVQLRWDDIRAHSGWF